jgi:transposase
MSLASVDLPSDPDALRAFALACQAELKAAQLSVQLRTLEIEKLKFQIAKLRRMQFGRSSERISRQIEQLELQLEELVVSDVVRSIYSSTNPTRAPIATASARLCAPSFSRTPAT